MFQKMKNLETAFQSMKSYTMIVVIGCLLFSTSICFLSYRAVSTVQSKIYILANGKMLDAVASNRKDNIVVEVKDHIKTFHENFFALDPDEKVIQKNITKALYLADGSAKRQYDNFKESGFYTNVISGNISEILETDSIVLNTSSAPFYFRYYGTETILRATNKLKRSLITEGYVREVSRSENNPHGFLLEKWNIIENRDIPSKDN